MSVRTTRVAAALAAALATPRRRRHASALVDQPLELELRDDPPQSSASLYLRAPNQFRRFGRSLKATYSYVHVSYIIGIGRALRYTAPAGPGPTQACP